MKTAKWFYPLIFFLFFLGCLVALASIYKLNDVSVYPFIDTATRKNHLQKGAKLYLNYCMGCHSLKYLHDDQLANDLGVEERDYSSQVLPTIASTVTPYRVHTPLMSALTATYGHKWFGSVPPDLSLIGREKGRAWLYKYLNSFYKDDSKIFGVNNYLVPNVNMPDVLEPLTKTLNFQQKSEALEELADFLIYTGDPARFIRYKAGVAVMIYMLVLFVFTWLLYKYHWNRLKNKGQ